MPRRLHARFSKLVLLCFFAVRILSPVLAQKGTTVQARGDFPDFLSVRAEFLSALITAPSKSAVQFKPAVRQTAGGTLRISVEQAADMFYVMFLRERTGTDSPASRGDMVITREISTGYIKALKWFLSDDGKSFLLLSPKNEKTLVDYVVGGALVRSGISVNTLLYYFIIRDFSFLYDALKSSINWNLVFVQAAAPAVEPSMAEISAELRSFGTIPESLLPGTKAGLLLRAILDISKVDEYFAGIGKPTAELSELSVIPFTAIAIGLDMRKEGDFAKALPWRQDRGFNIDIIQPLLTLGNGWVYYVLVDSDDGKTAVKLLALVSPGGDGVRHIDFFDAERREFIDLGILIKARPEAHARVFQLSAP